MTWYTYILLCDRKTYYVGITNDLSERLNSHKAKKNIATKEFYDLELVHSEEYVNQTLAAKREKQLKGWSWAKKNALVSGNIGLLKYLCLSKGLRE